MNSNTGDGNRGAKITPSARPSIHKYFENSQSKYQNMGRYGTRSRNIQHHQKQNLQGDVGTDVVDNVQSKMSLPIDRNNSANDSKGRRYSNSDAISECSDDFEDENVLSQSCPAKFSSHYRGDTYTSALEDVSYRSGLRSQTCTPILNRSNKSSNGFNTSANLENERNSSKPNVFNILVPLGMIVFAIIVYQIYCSTKKLNVYNELDYFKDIKDLETKYKVSKNSLLRIRSGISNIFNKKETGSFIFVYDSETENFNPSVFNSFIEEVATKTARYLRNDTEQTDHVVVDTKNINTDVQLMDLYRGDVARSGVMLVRDVNLVASGVAMAFHYYCDEYNPLVKRSAIFFTLDAATCKKISDERSTHQYIEKCLSMEWDNIHEDKIGPLLARVVNIIIDVRNMA